MTPQARLNLTNIGGIGAIVLTIVGSAMSLYSAVKENKAAQDQINMKRDIQIEALVIADRTTLAREERFEILLLEIRDRQIRMEERQKKTK